MKDKEIKVKVSFTDGYQDRFTKACIQVARKREQCENTQQKKT